MIGVDGSQRVNSVLPLILFEWRSSKNLSRPRFSSANMNSRRRETSTLFPSSRLRTAPGEAKRGKPTVQRPPPTPTCPPPSPPAASRAFHLPEFPQTAAKKRLGEDGRATERRRRRRRSEEADWTKIYDEDAASSAAAAKPKKNDGTHDVVCAAVVVAEAAAWSAVGGSTCALLYTLRKEPARGRLWRHRCLFGY